MDLLRVQVKNTNRSPALLPLNCSIACCPKERRAIGWLEIKVFNRKVCSYRCRSLTVVSAKAKKNNGNSNNSNNDDDNKENGGRSPRDGEVSKGKKSPDGNKTNHGSSQKPIRASLDWREFRANLVAKEQAHKSETTTHNQGKAPLEPKPLGLKWAHPLSVPENGCVLVATEKLDGVRTFERTVVLLLRSGTSHPQEGPFGIVINRPLNKKIKHMKPNNNELATTFSDCSLHFGGPLEASMFLLKTGEKTKLPGFEEVVPGLSFGARNSLDDAAELVKKGLLKPQDFRFFVGYAGWQLDQLREEIESEYWHVASCSSNLICGGSVVSGNLWEEILQLMGGDYSELSRKPKQDS
ncbi:UPF0301 protein Plut_0637 [Linum perenne]